MSEAASAPEPTPKRDYGRFHVLLRNDFLLRRIHSLTGVVPLTLFLIEHLFTNSRSTQGPESFNGAVKFMTGLPLFMIIEWAGIYIPLAIHLILGIWIARTARHNVDNYKYGGNWRYLFQRVTGIFIVLFLVVHLGHWRYGVRVNYIEPGATEAKLIALRHYTPYELKDKEFPAAYRVAYEQAWLKEKVGRTEADLLTTEAQTALQVMASKDNMFSGMKAAFSTPGWFLFYVLGLAAACYHTGNGLWTFLITWGVLRNPKAQERCSTACLGFGAALFALGVFSLAGFVWGPQMAPMLEAIGFQHVEYGHK